MKINRRGFLIGAALFMSSPLAWLLAKPKSKTVATLPNYIIDTSGAMEKRKGCVTYDQISAITAAYYIPKMIDMVHSEPLLLTKLSRRTADCK